MLTLGLPAEAAESTRLSCKDTCSVQALTSQVRKTITPGQNLVIKEPSLITSEGRVPVITIPACGASQITVDPPILKQVVAQDSSESLDRALSETIEKISIIQQYLRDQNIGAAQSALNALRQEYPKLTFLNFIEASIAVLKGNRKDAIRLAEAGLRSHPNYQEGQELLKNLRSNR